MAVSNILTNFGLDIFTFPLHRCGGDNNSNHKENVDKTTKSTTDEHHDDTASSLYEQMGKPLFEGKKMGAEMLVKAEQAFEHVLEDEVHNLFPHDDATNNVETNAKAKDNSK